MVTVAERLRAIVEALPEQSSVTLPADVLRGWLADEPATSADAAELAVLDPPSWRERLWTVPADTRLGVRELAEALDRSADWVYRSVSVGKAEAHGRDPLPCSRLDGSLVFTAGAVRRWITASEIIVNPDRASSRPVLGLRRQSGGAR